MEHAEWALKVASWLRGLGYDLRLIDCLYPSRDGEVKQEIRKVVQVCSTLEWNFATYREMRRNNSDVRPSFCHRITATNSSSACPSENWSHFSVNAQPDLFEGDSEWTPDEIWITSIMTYWWESTRDTVLLMKKLYPTARIRIGGIYPTLSPHHLRHSLAAAGYEFALSAARDLTVERELAHTVIRNGDSIVTGEIPEASTADLDFECYRQMTRAIESEERLPDYAILTTSRGCPFDCSYCAQKAYNEGSLKVRIRSAKDTFEEIRDKYHTYGVRHVAFYEDNFLLEKPNVERLLRLLLQYRSEMPHLKLYAPEGIEVRLRHEDLNFVKLMRETGFESVYLPLETMSREVTRAWNRRHSHAALFEKAVNICHEANFKLHEMEVNAFILFGMPDENLQDVVNTMFYASQMVGGIVPMLFTPVPGSIMYEQYESYLMDEMGFDLHHLNGKLYPFLKYNFERTAIRLSDYVALESLAFRLNAKTMGQTFPLDERNGVYRSLRSVLSERENGISAQKAGCADLKEMDERTERAAKS